MSEYNVIIDKQPRGMKWLAVIEEEGDTDCQSGRPVVVRQYYYPYNCAIFIFQ